MNRPNGDPIILNLLGNLWKEVKERPYIQLVPMIALIGASIDSQVETPVGEFEILLSAAILTYTLTRLAEGEVLKISLEQRDKASSAEITELEDKILKRELEKAYYMVDENLKVQILDDINDGAIPINLNDYISLPGTVRSFDRVYMKKRSPAGGYINLRIKNSVRNATELTIIKVKVNGEFIFIDVFKDM
jgi:hypothetical protein